MAHELSNSAWMGVLVRKYLRIAKNAVRGKRGRRGCDLLGAIVPVNLARRRNEWDVRLEEIRGGAPAQSGRSRGSIRSQIDIHKSIIRRWWVTQPVTVLSIITLGTFWANSGGHGAYPGTALAENCRRPVGFQCSDNRRR